MKKYFVFGFFLLLGCVDRINFDTRTDEYPIVVEGNITDQPGPYQIRTTRSFDVQSKDTPKTRVSVKRITIFDNHGSEEVLTPIEEGIYQTSDNGIRGVVGRVYKIRVELFDGSIFESVPDTLKPSGLVDDIRFKFFEEKNNDKPTNYGFDIFFDANGSPSSSDFVWRVKGTYQIETNPELYEVKCGESTCPDPRACSGYVPTASGISKIGPCECCTCWVDFYSEVPIVSSSEFVRNGVYKNVKAYRLPVTGWYFMHKVRIEVQQMSLSAQALRFWTAIRVQKESVNSLFQPVSGQIPSNYIQINGQEGRLQGFFYATSITSKDVFIDREDVAARDAIPEIVPFKESCLRFPRSTNIQPDFWR